ncbi:MAG: Rha family transcriptional regulator, partial [Azonexus sp.]
MTAASDIVAVTHGKATTTSVLVANLFGRHHRNVIRSIDRLIENRVIDALSVERISYQDSMNREQVAYRIPERESLIVMPFIGGRRAEEGQRILVDAFLAARAEINRLHRMHASPDWQQARIEGKTARRNETDVIAAFVEYATNQGSRNARRYYICLTKETNRALFMVTSAFGKNVRQKLSAQQLASVAMAEHIVERSL